jgi:hypothetical protein
MSLAVLALGALSCSPQQPANLRAATSIQPRDAFCGEADCGWLFEPGACQAMADWLSIPGQFSDVRLELPAVGHNSTVVDGETFTVDLQSDVTTFDWTATAGVDFVIATSDDNSNVYEYVPRATADSGLTAYAGNELTLVLFCRNATAASSGCTLTQGYWKTHSRQGPAPYDGTWSKLGAEEEDTVFFRSGQTWLQVFRTTVRGNAYYTLAHQYMAARLNVLAGADSAAVSAELAWATRFFEDHTPDMGFSPSVAPTMIAKADALARFNEGAVGPGHCE